MEKTSSKRRFALGLIVLTFVTLGYLLFRDHSYSARLEDGSIILYGASLAFSFRLIPDRHGKPSLGALALLRDVRNVRVVYSSNDGQHYYGSISDFSKYGKAYYSLVSKRTLGIRIEISEPGNEPTQAQRTWKTIASFRIRNPAKRESKNWRAEIAPIERMHESLSVTLNEVMVGPEPRNFIHEAPLAALSFQTKHAGQIVTNWQAQNIVLRDADGNFLALSWPVLINYERMEDLRRVGP